MDMMRKMIERVPLFLLTMLMIACDTVFDVHPYDTRIKGETDINAKNIAKIESLFKDRDTLIIAVISDSHQWYNDLEDEIADINRRDSIDFVMHLGDITDFGATQEYVWARDRLQRLNVPYVVMQGNHDCLGTGNQTFDKMFGNNDFSFIAGRIKFLMINTNAIEYDYSEPVPDFSFLEKEAVTDTSLFDRTIVCMHARPYSEQFNNNVAKPFNYYLHNFPDLLFCLYGHGHHTEEHDIFGDGTIYYETASAEKREYRIITITKEGYNHEIITF